MKFTFFKNTFFLIVLTVFACGSSSEKEHYLPKNTSQEQEIAKNNGSKIIVGAERFDAYSKYITGKKIGIVANQTSFLSSENQHLVDFLISKEISVSKVYAPEHGFRGTADAGEHIKDGVDSKTGIPIISLYGNNKKPTQKQLENIDIMIFDIQDVGARFYTYISTLHYVMEACAEAGIPVMILDRPNPNGHYIDGPILEKEHKSFVGMHPVPVVHGMTIAEYAQMVNGEKWLEKNLNCDLIIIEMENYNHQKSYSLPIKPSPNLPNDQSINLYPSLCFFEGTPINAGRGTDMQFQIFGSPKLPEQKFSFSYTPQSNEGAKNPKFKGELCYGKNLQDYPKLNQINLEWLIETYEAYGKPKDFFTSFFTLLSGTKTLQQQIEKGMTSEEIRNSWKSGLAAYEKIRANYLIYK